MSEIDMKERIARAIYESIKADFADSPAYVGDWDSGHVTVDGDVNMHLLAEAVLAAMREPTERMMNAPYEADIDFGPGGKGDIDAGPENVWQAMIDAAKNENPKPPSDASTGP